MTRKGQKRTCTFLPFAIILPPSVKKQLTNVATFRKKVGDTSYTWHLTTWKSVAVFESEVTPVVTPKVTPGRSATQGDAFFARPPRSAWAPTERKKASQAPSGQEKGKNSGRPWNIYERPWDFSVRPWRFCERPQRFRLMPWNIVEKGWCDTWCDHWCDHWCGQTLH